MKTQVTVVPVDTLIIVDGEALQFTFEASDTLHALQWFGQDGWVEYTLTSLNKSLNGQADYDTYVHPYVELWEAEKARLYAEANKPLTLDEAKKAKVTEINQGYASRVSAVKADTVQEEVDTWDIQRLEAMSWELDNTEATPQLDIIALNRGIPREELIQRTLIKTKAFEQYVFTLLGTKQKYEDAIEAATTVEEVNALFWGSLEAVVMEDSLYAKHIA